MTDDLTFGTNAGEEDIAKPAAKAKAGAKAKGAASGGGAKAGTKAPQGGTAAGAKASPKAAPGAAPGTAAPAAATVGAADEMSRILGQIVSLLGQSPAHKHIFLSDLEWLVLPALIARQVRVWRRQTERGVMPVAYASWAMVSEEVDQRLGQGQMRLKPSEWRCGDIPWVIDLVAPYGGSDTALKELADQIAKDKPVKILMPSSGGGFAVREIKGSAPN